jgi:hypothetical protein
MFIAWFSVNIGNSEMDGFLIGRRTSDGIPHFSFSVYAGVLVRLRTMALPSEALLEPQVL